MSEQNGSKDAAESGISARAAEIVVAMILIGLGGLVIYDSVRLGARWAEDGPQAGYFPFYIGLLICVGSVVTLGQALFRGKRGGGRLFVAWAPLRQVLAVLVPGCLFVLGIQLIGIYVAATVYIAVFMIWLGKYGWGKSLFLGFMVSVATFLMFEVWFQVPLFKGLFNPLGFLGY